MFTSIAFILYFFNTYSFRSIGYDLDSVNDDIEDKEKNQFDRKEITNF